MRYTMKKILTALIVLSYATLSMADEIRTYKQVSGTNALVTIKTDETDGTQAVVYVDAQENDRFVKEMLKNKKSPLAELKKQIELENCETTSTDDNPWIDACGEVHITDMIRTSFGRGGWMSAGAGYTFFVGFRSDGTGHFFDATHMVVIEEVVEAEMDDDMNYKGIVNKHLSLSGIKALDNNAHPSLK